MASSKLEADLAALADLSPAQLRCRWSKLTARPVPRVSPALLRLALAWELQAGVYGGLARQTSQTLEQLARGKTRTQTASPGTRLAREWNGVLHVVAIEQDGGVRWNERRWNSLSEVARVITGTRWSGPAFFGLKERRAP